MATDEQQAARRIMDQFGEESRIPLLNIDEGDIGVLLAFPITGLFLAGFTGMESLAFPLVTAGLGFGTAVIYVTPDHLTATQWLTDVVRYAKRPRTTYSAPSDSEATHNEGGLANYTPFKPDERTQDLTNIERAWPGAGAIERQDGAMQAFIEVSPGNMDFAMSGDWAHLQEAGEEFANTELDFPLTLHATTQSFPVDTLISQIEARLTDTDATENPVFRSLLEEYRDQRPREMQDQGVQQLRYYLGVTVDRREVYDRYRDERTPAEKLTTIPVLGFLFNPFVTRRESLTTPEVRGRMFEKLDERIETVRTEFIENASGWSGRRLTTVELFLLNAEFWNGTTHEYGTAERVVRDHPVMNHSPREDTQ
ncbi:hypothetical protein ACFQH6_04645 [Halobacteriaceae archaeon GCM10025711]